MMVGSLQPFREKPRGEFAECHLGLRHTHPEANTRQFFLEFLIDLFRNAAIACAGRFGVPNAVYIYIGPVDPAPFVKSHGSIPPFHWVFNEPTNNSITIEDKLAGHA